ncbi:MAG TPA: HAD-IC family P-type ATPase, partial [Anaerolineae bacterium]
MEYTPLTALFQRLESSATGLSTEQARKRLTQNGANEPAPTRQLSFLREILSFFASPLVVILLIAGGASAALGELIDAGIIVLMVLLSVILNFVQTFRSQRAVEKLRAQVSLTAEVLRDGEWREIPRREIVPGDLVRLTAGDLVPADARLLQARDLHVNQAALTGESLPVEKEAGPADGQPRGQAGAPDEKRETVFLGTSVISGTATALVFATGARTQFGDIAARLLARPPETEFERGTRRFGLLIARTVIFLVLFVFLVSAASHRDPLQALLFAVALAVGLTPEFLPMITTVTLGQGALRMAREKVVVKHLEAIQNLGSIDILCSDKTGTLTSGEMSLEAHVDPLGNPSERAFLLAYLNSYHETGIKNPLDEAILRKGTTNPLDAAILLHDHPDVHAYQKIDEIPFDFERRRLSLVIGTDSTRWLITKGAPENILPICTVYETNGEIQPLDADARARLSAVYQKFSAEGLRVLAVAYRLTPPQEAYRVVDEARLTLAGFLTFLDPPLPDASEVLEELRAHGVEVKILTGDSELVAQNVCDKV